MSLLSPRLQLKVAQKQILTPGLVQMVTILQLNRLELKEMVTQEIVKNPVLEEATEEAGEEITADELLPLLEAETIAEPADKELLEAANLNGANPLEGAVEDVAINGHFATVKMRVLVQQIVPATSGRSKLMPPQAVHLDDGWIQVGGVWYRRLDAGGNAPAAPRSQEIKPD